MDQPPWLAAAWAEFGVREIPGKDDAPEILRYFREAGDTSVETEATPWCAAFLGAMLKRAGCSGTGSLLARSYLDWGDALDASRLGAVAVLSRGDDPNAGHVGFLLSEANGKLYLLGGNQGDAVTVAGFDKTRLLGLRWPKENPEPESMGDDAIFLKALAHVLEMEGGYSNDPYDPGGPTNRGITLDVYASFKNETVDDASRALFGITANETFYPALPEAVRARYGRAEWETNFDSLGQYARDPNAQWRGFGLDLCCEEGRSLHCLELFGRQLICALHGLHPLAVLAFTDRKAAKAA